MGRARQIKKTILILLIISLISLIVSSCSDATSAEDKSTDSVSDTDEITNGNQFNRQSTPTLSDDDEFEIDIDKNVISSEVEGDDSSENINDNTEETISSQSSGTDSQPSASFTYTDISTTVYATANLTVRSGPSETFAAIGTLLSGDEISVTGVCVETGWYRIAFDEAVAYCNAEYTSETKITARISDDASSSGVVSAGDDQVTQYYVDLCRQSYEEAPIWVRDEFEESGWQIKIRSGHFASEYGYGDISVKALTVTDEKTIYISNREVACTTRAVGHELGHFIDWYNGWPSTSDEFSEIYDIEYDTFCKYFGYSNGSYNSPYELFAEALYYYWTDPGNLANAVPRTYVYIKNAVGW